MHHGQLLSYGFHKPESMPSWVHVPQHHTKSCVYLGKLLRKRHDQSIDLSSWFRVHQPGIKDRMHYIQFLSCRLLCTAAMRRRLLLSKRLSAANVPAWFILHVWRNLPFDVQRVPADAALKSSLLDEVGRAVERQRVGIVEARAPCQGVGYRARYRSAKRRRRIFGRHRQPHMMVHEVVPIRLSQTPTRCSVSR